MPRILAALFIGTIASLAARPAAAQMRIAFHPATMSSAAAKAAPALASAATAKPAAKPAPKLFESLLARGSNPKGPFARVSLMQRDTIIAKARELLGVRYKWAGIDPVHGLDCSGIVKYVFAKLGIELPHHAADIAKLGHAVAKDTAAMQPGDLLVFGIDGAISHVGIYVGEGMMIHASSSFKSVVETAVASFRPGNGVRWQGVRRVIALDTLAEGDTPPPSQ